MHQPPASFWPPRKETQSRSHFEDLNCSLGQTQPVSALTELLSRDMGALIHMVVFLVDDLSCTADLFEFLASWTRHSQPQRTNSSYGSPTFCRTVLMRLSEYTWRTQRTVDSTRSWSQSDTQAMFRNASESVHTLNSSTDTSVAIFRHYRRISGKRRDIGCGFSPLIAKLLMKSAISSFNTGVLEQLDPIHTIRRLDPVMNQISVHVAALAKTCEAGEDQSLAAAIASALHADGYSLNGHRQTSLPPSIPGTSRGSQAYYVLREPPVWFYLPSVLESLSADPADYSFQQKRYVPIFERAEQRMAGRRLFVLDTGNFGFCSGPVEVGDIAVYAEHFTNSLMLRPACQRLHRAGRLCNGSPWSHASADEGDESMQTHLLVDYPYINGLHSDITADNYFFEELNGKEETIIVLG
ncbi:uncharacterized protein B0I36DRAFT_396840 [Microdochium trichocladiopsis]|uniref:Uncharacterized protein n=1 Tax=Microdochium trichocladiopsis TaxID=1682393 RepID=A0A9P8XWH9_9PEZI|nr:uncharacterized protein B0I36DRAFT_396840 [Microdochium trichocladiopsis]KAH7016415.1 hypothetical protein B0I36DRAFT_396840 [Microdochium trichocladiopsis]